MMKIVTSHWFSLLWTTFVMLVSVVISIYTKEPMHVARAGALVTLAGIFMTTRRILISSSEKQSIIGKQITEKVDDECTRNEEEENLKAEKCGFWFLVIGTVIWAYGDLLLVAISN